MLRTLILLLFLTCPSVSYADQADVLKQSVERALAHKKSVAALQGTQFSYDGALLVEDAGGYFAITLPDITVTKDSQKVDLGIISINAAPTKDKNVWRFRLALPTPIRFIDNQTGQTVTKIDLPKQNIEALWYADADMYTSLSAQFDNALIEHVADNTRIALENVAIQTAISGLDHKRLADYYESVEQWLTRRQAPDYTPSPEDLTLANSLFGFYMSDYVESADSSIKVKGLQVLKSVSKDDGTSHYVEVSRAENTDIIAGFTSKEGNFLDVIAQLNGSGISDTNAQRISALGAPNTMTMSLKLENAPKAELFNVIKDAASTAVLSSLASKNPTQVTTETMQIDATKINAEHLKHQNALKTAAIQAGTKVIMKFNAGEEGFYGFDNLLELQGSAKAPQGGFGRWLMTIKGFDKLKDAVATSTQEQLNAEQLKEQGLDLSEEDIERAKRNSVMIMSLVESIGKPEVTENGGKNLSFEALLAEDGQFTLNNMPFQQIMAMVMPAILMASGVNMTVQMGEPTQETSSPQAPLQAPIEDPAAQTPAPTPSSE